MDLGYLPKGIILGFSIAAPVGPIGVLCIRRTLAAGRAVGFISGLGAATADAVYGAIAGFGITVITRALVTGQDVLRLGGGLFLCYLGARIVLTRPAEEASAVAGHGLLGAYASTFLLTLTNPTTILSFVAIFAGIGVGAGGANSAVALLVLGVFLGSALWWLLLSGGVGLLRARLTTDRMVVLNYLSGAIIAGFGAAALGSLIT